tara:strand:- start:319 stop:978 length:660 start_codon:yes stop_codon:yes gene_type:complete
MPYYPKNKVQINLYTNGKDLVRVSDLSSYTGFYYKTYTGQSFVGKTPNSNRYPEELINPLDLITPSTDIQTQIVNNRIVDNQNSVYIRSLNELPQPRKVPTPFYPKPSPNQYITGYFSRYFAKQVNDTDFTEIDNRTYDGISSHNSEYLWELYNVVTIPWQLTGDVENVYQTNLNLVKIQEKKGFIGLSIFLNKNYIKFYKGKDNHTDPKSLPKLGNMK